jgi:hypothetical protein
MGRKFTFEQVEKAFNDSGYELLETNYVDSKTKMRYRCPHHPNKELYIRVSELTRGGGCIYCGKRRGQRSE